MRSNVKKVISQTTAATINGPSIIADQILALSVHAVAGGTEVGTVKVQVSNDGPGLGVDSQGNPVPVNWVDLPSASVAVSSAGNYLIPKTETCYRYVRVVYTHTSGTGSMNINLSTFGY